MTQQLTKQDIFNQICDILVDDFECPREKMKPETKMFDDLDLDSIDAVDLIVRLQKMTKIKVQPEDFKQIRTLWDIAEVIDRLIQTQTADAPK